MSHRLKRKIITTLLFTTFFVGIGFYLGWKSYPKFKQIKPQVIEKVKEVKIPIDFDDEQYVKYCFEKVGKEEGIDPRIFFIIRECEGGSAWILNRTKDGGHLQVNWNTGLRYGAKDLRDFVDPCRQAKIASEILKKEGISAWVTKKCIERKLIFTQDTSK
jgi:hypothetical protein